MPAAVAFFGLGAFGAPLAMRLRQAGFRLAVHDPRADALAAHRALFGNDTSQECDASLWITCVTDEAAAAALYFDPGGLAQRMPAGSLALDHTTTSPAFARKAAQALALRGIGFVDSPLSGGVTGAQDGTLLAMLGGAPADCTRAATALTCYCRRIETFGAAGNGQAAKLANQMAIAGTLRGLFEAARFARATGLDVHQLFEALAAGSAHSAQMDQHAAALTARALTFGTQFGWIAKDLALARDELVSAGAESGMADWLLERLSGERA
jgi:3-hydroxyisobutyrate dehydrogenase-like beta-hydroxyacid dehydrogenase